MGAVALYAIAFVGVSLYAAQTPAGQTAAIPAIPATRTGEEIFRATCVTCHHIDGKGSPRSVVGFDVELPDFTDCGFATAEADSDWHAVVHEGGTIRGLDRHMPAFGDALSKADIARVVTYLRGFCADRSWPRGDLNFPRPFFTEKAFPESETVFTTSFSRRGTKEVEQAIEYERRIGSRGQLIVEIPFLMERSAGPWARGLADMEVGYKHTLVASLRTGTIVSASTVFTLPSGNETTGFGGGTVVYEPIIHAAQRLPWESFLQGQVGWEFAHEGGDKSIYSRLAFGRSFAANHGFGRLWTPQVEALWSRPFGGESEWDIAPSLQVSLSKLQHIRAAVGARVPVTQRSDRSTQVLFYLLWEWADGGFFEFWK